MNRDTLPTPRRDYPWSFLLVEEKPGGFELRLTYVLHLTVAHRIEASEIVPARMFASLARHGFDLLTMRRQALQTVCLQAIKRHMEEGR